MTLPQLLGWIGGVESGDGFEREGVLLEREGASVELSDGCNAGRDPDGGGASDGRF